MISRKNSIKSNIKDMSILLLGPRQVGKSTLLKSLFSETALFIDLLNPEIYRDLQKNPNLLNDYVSATDKKIIVIDEIQKIPELMNVVHFLIEKYKSIRFILTGSSARKLKKKTSNLLGGRAFPSFLHPLTSDEYLKKENSKIDDLIQFGGLPSIVLASNPLKKLKAYTSLYLQEEIKAEGYVRNLSDFSRFLDVAGLTNSEQLDFESVASDVQISSRTVAAYYQILEDTLIGYLLESFKKTKTRKAVIKPKFYFFDVGVANYLSGRDTLSVGTPEYGKAVEHFIFTELKAYQDYTEKDFKLFYWRSSSKFEIDFLIETKNKELIAIEVKAKKKINEKDFKGIKAFEDDFKLSKKIVVSLETMKRKTADDFIIYPLAEFCKQLWDGKII